MRHWNFNELVNKQQAAKRAYVEFLRVPALSAGIYTLPAGGVDPQQPHREDEVYFVQSGRGMMMVGETSFPVSPGSLVYVPAGVEHRFHTIEEGLQILVFFAPAESNS